MRKTVIALLIVLPMVFVLVIFSSLNLVSINVHVSVSGIRVYADGDLLAQGEAFYVDMADQKDHTVTAQVEPANAFEKGYTLESDNPDVLTINSDGLLTAFGEGTANIKATSKDKGYSASVPVVVTSSKPYGVSFLLFDSDGEAVPMNYNSTTLTYKAASKLDVGTYTYSVKIYGGDSDQYDFTTNEDQAVINKGDQTVMLPFSGETTLELTINDALVNGMLNQSILRHISLDVAKVQSNTGIVVNGVPDGNTVLLAKGATQTIIYVECEGEPQFVGAGVKAECLSHQDPTARAATRAAATHHRLIVTLEDDFSGDELDATLTANGNSVPVKLSFSDFDFKLRSSIIGESGGGYNSVILKDTPTTFYAVPAVDLQDVNFVWSCEDGDLTLTPDVNGSSCSFNATRNGEYLVEVQAQRIDKNSDAPEKLGAPKQLKLTVTTKIESIRINNKVDADLAERYTVGGQKYISGSLNDNNEYSIEITVRKKGQSPSKNDFEDIEFVSSDPTVATVEIRDGKAYLDIKNSDAITITAQWRYNDKFGGNAIQSVKLNVVKDAVEVDNYPDLVKATDAALKVVLTKDIMLGTNADGSVMDWHERQDIIDSHKIKSTYNTVFYELDSNHNKDEAYIHYAMEFKNDVYGNGFNLTAEYFTNEVDAAGVPRFFLGPLVFVEYKAAASVAGQDNIAFLIRTDGVKLYGVNLLGCNDSSLYEYDGSGNPTYQLNKLNKLGTTLEINADCEVINCRIRNGRNVVRVYGGNSDGNNYFVTSIPAKDLNADEQIKVTIDGCLITQGREFLVKVGSNKALQASNANGQEPVLRDERGMPYPEQDKTFNGAKYYTNNYNVGDFGTDSFFYKRYVMTDLTVRNTVLETSGLFCVGVESNFSGDLLYEGVASKTGTVATYAKITTSWRKSGATSFASILRLEGDVRTYDWKDVSQVDSSTLIEPVGNGGLSDVMKFDVASMLKEVDGNPDYANLLHKTSDGKTFVHGGIAFYGGGRNYSQIVVDLNEDLNNLKHLSINIGQFINIDSPVVRRQAELLPYAAGTHDFNFWMYTSDCSNNYDKQQSDINNGVKYSGIAKVPLFDI